MDIMAICMILTGAVAWGLYSVLGRKYAHETGGAIAIPYFQLTLATCLPFYFTSHAMMPWELPTSLLTILLIFSICQFLAQQSWFYGTRHGNIVVLSLVADFIPWLSLISAHLFLGAEITISTMIAAVTLVAGAMITRFGTM